MNPFPPALGIHDRREFIFPLLIVLFAISSNFLPSNLLTVPNILKNRVEENVVTRGMIFYGQKIFWTVHYSRP